MKKSKNQNGAISLFVLLSMLFFLAFMLGAFSLVTRRNATQVEALKETQSIYKAGASASEIYDSIVASNDSVVPISNIEQLKKAAEIEDSTDTQANYLIDGKLYTYKKDANYILQNDIILNLKEEIDGKNAITIYDYILYSEKYNVDSNGYDIYYEHTDGSFWKCISYQNIGLISDSKLFSTEIENEYYYGKSYSADRYSILENGVDIYKKAWSDTTDFEFMLMYNSYSELFNVSKYNRWRQKNNPAKENIADVEIAEGTEGTETIVTANGYTIDYTGGTTEGYGAGDSWGGLTRSTSTSCYLDGSVGVSDAYFQVATTVFSGTYGIPVTTVTDYGGANSASEYLLFVRVK